ncbi:MAG: hypothetical protein Q9187_007360, partial [Circinaria calcarea]
KLPAPSQIFSTLTTTSHHPNGGLSNTHAASNGDVQTFDHQDDDPLESDLINAPEDEDNNVHGQTGEFTGVLDPKLRGDRARAQAHGVMQGVESGLGRSDYGRGYDGANGRG